MNIRHLTVGLLQTNCFLLIEPTTKEAWIIDPGGNVGDVMAELAAANARLTRIINTHAHFDHVLAAPDIQQATGASFHLHQAEQPVLDYSPIAVKSWLGWDWGPPPQVESYLQHGQTLTMGSASLEIRHIPGHSPGSVAFIDHQGRQAWVGDAIFRENIGRTDLPGGNRRQLLQSIHDHIFTLPEDYTLYPGHGPFTTVGHERRYNPWT